MKNKINFQQKNKCKINKGLRNIDNMFTKRNITNENFEGSSVFLRIMKKDKKDF